MGITINDIAKEANVSASTVSRVINDSGYVGKATRQRVERIIKQRSYVPSAMAKQLANGRNNVIGVLVPEIDNPFFSGVIKGINEVADEENLCVILCNSSEDPEKEHRIVRTLNEQRVSGLILTSAMNELQQNSDYIKAFSQLDIPIVLVDREIEGENYDGVFFNDEKAIFDITSLLIRNGHTHIELLAGTPKLKLGQNRIRGYRTAFQRSNLQYEDQWIHRSPFTQEDGYDLMRAIIDRDREKWPTAVVSNNNMLSMGALRAIFEKKISIPQDIAFVGYDQIEMLEVLGVHITLAEKNVIEMGRTAMSMLCERIKHGHEKLISPRKIIMMPNVVVRGSESPSR